MKTTVKISRDQAFVIEPSTGGGVRLGIVTRSEDGLYKSGEFHQLTADQAGAIIFGIEIAAEAVRVAAEREQLTAEQLTA
jgi:hypothetical protein